MFLGNRDSRIISASSTNLAFQSSVLKPSLFRSASLRYFLGSWRIFSRISFCLSLGSRDRLRIRSGETDSTSSARSLASGAKVWMASCLAFSRYTLALAMPSFPAADRIVSP